jgi:hypothetical protein
VHALIRNAFPKVLSHPDLSPGALQCRDVRGIDGHSGRAADDSMTDATLWEVG